MDIATASTRSVSDLALEVPGAAAAFDRLGIDFCCGGRRSLADACEAKGLELEPVLAALAALEGTAPAEPQWRSVPLGELTQHIARRHHQYVRAETPRLTAWLDKVVAAHGERHHELATLRAVFLRMSGDLAQHMAKEEMILFPAIARAAAGDGAADAPTSAVLAQPVRRMMAEHDIAGRDLAEMRQLTGGYQPPSNACTTWRVLYQGLAEFEADMHQHVHLENNVLFPRALALGAEARA
jgi:regulator of cell morphogenesis and NO signaling